MLTLSVLLLSLVPQTDVASDRVEVIELNYVYDEACNRILNQWIFWTWSEADQQYRVVHWTIRKKGEIALPTNDGWRLRFQDRGMYREVTATSYREIHTQWDREVDDRKVLPLDQRKGLSKCKIR